MNDFNPYQTPASDEPAQGCWRRGGKVWLAAGSALPCRCIRCAAETAAEEGKNVNLYWTPPAALLLSAAAVVLFFIFAPLNTKNAFSAAWEAFPKQARVSAKPKRQGKIRFQTA